MTSRNLNTTWRDTIFKQYAADFEADVPYPVRYLINAPPWKDIFITVPEKIDLRAYKNAGFTFYKLRRCSEDPTYEDEHISVRPRKAIGGAAAEVPRVMDEDDNAQESIDENSTSVRTT
jgi:hypothetical protein